MERLLVFLPLLFPLYLLKFSLGGFPFTVPEIVIDLSFLVWLILEFMDGGVKGVGLRLQRFWQMKMNRWFVAGIFLFLLGAFLSLVVTPAQVTLIDGVTVFESRKIALGILKGWIFPGIFLVILLKRHVKTEAQIEKTLLMYVVSTFVLSLIGLLQVFFSAMLPYGEVLQKYFVESGGRLTGPFESPNYFALYSAPAWFYLFVSLGKIGRWKATFSSLDFWKKIGVWGAYLLLSLSLFLTKSYGAFVALGLVAFGYIILRFTFVSRKNLRKGVMMVGLSVIIFLVMVLGVYLIDPGKFSDVGQLAQRNSSSVRMEVYTIALHLLQNNWFFGIGLGQFPALYQLQAPGVLGHAPYEWNMLHPHNIFLATWLNTGLIGFLGFFTLLGYVFTNWKVHRKHRLTTVVFAMILIQLLHGLVDTPFYKNDLAYLFWTLLAMMWILRDQKNVFMGKVVEGQKLGRGIGFPTINIEPGPMGLPFGVYVCEVTLNGKTYLGAMNWGGRSVQKTQAPAFEVHVLDFSEDVYGEQVSVRVGKKLRDVMKFSHLEALKEQIGKDVAEVKSQGFLME